MAATTAIYRRAVDAAWEALTAGSSSAAGDAQEDAAAVAEAGRLRLQAAEWRDLQQVFARGQDASNSGLTPGFLEGSRHQRLVRGRNPRHRGTFLGTVKQASVVWVGAAGRQVMPSCAIASCLVKPRHLPTCQPSHGPPVPLFFTAPSCRSPATPWSCTCSSPSSAATASCLTRGGRRSRSREARCMGSAQRAAPAWRQATQVRRGGECVGGRRGGVLQQRRPRPQHCATLTLPQAPLWRLFSGGARWTRLRCGRATWCGGTRTPRWRSGCGPATRACPPPRSAACRWRCGWRRRWGRRCGSR